MGFGAFSHLKAFYGTYISNFSDNSKYSTSPVHTYSNSTSFYALKCFIYIASTPTANWESPNNLTAQNVGGGRGKHAGRKPAWESACCEATQATLCHPGRLILIQMLFEMNLYRDCIYSSFFFFNNKKKRKLIGLSNCQILHKNLCFPLHKTTFKKSGTVFQMLATDLCALLVVDCTQAKPRCCTNFNSSDSRKVFHLATVHFETALVLVDLAFVDCTADCIHSDFWKCSWGHTLTFSPVLCLQRFLQILIL